MGERPASFVELTKIQVNVMAWGLPYVNCFPLPAWAKTENPLHLGCPYFVVMHGSIDLEKVGIPLKSYLWTPYGIRVKPYGRPPKLRSGLIQHCPCIIRLHLDRRYIEQNVENCHLYHFGIKHRFLDAIHSV